MARNGAGTYTLPAGNPVTTGTTISSSWANNTLNDIASGLTTSLAYDGQTTPVANLPMGNYAHTGVGNATVRTMYASAGQVQDGVLSYLTSISGTDTITAIAPISMTALVAGQTFRFIAAGANTTTAVTLNINSLGAKSITKNGTTALAIGDIPSGSVVNVTYDGTQFQISNVDSSSFSAGTTGFTPTTSTSGSVTLAGTLNVANGGTGTTTLGTGNLIVGNATSAVTTLAPANNGQSLIVKAGSSVNAGSFVVGATYTITSVGTTSFTSIGASSNTVGIVFTATGVGSGSGTATLNTWSTGSSIVTGTAVATTSGTSFTFSSIPSWVKRVTLMFNSVSLGTANQLLVQIGSGSVATTGYSSASGWFSNAATSTTSSSAGFIIYLNNASNTYTGTLTLNLIDSNTYIASYIGAGNGIYPASGGGSSPALSGPLDRVVVTSNAFTDPFDAGLINISYE